MAITRLGGATAITGTIPQGNIANASLGAVTALPGAIATGKVLQAVTNTHATRFSTSSGSYVGATGYTIAITPSATSSKIFVIISAMTDSGASGRGIVATIYRGSTNLGNTPGINDTYSSGARIYAPNTMSVLDSPSSTSAVTYQVYVKTSSGAAVVYNDTEGEAQLTAFEIAG